MSIKVNNKRYTINTSPIPSNSKKDSINTSVSVAFKALGKYGSTKSKNSSLSNATLSYSKPIGAALRAIG